MNKQHFRFSALLIVLTVSFSFAQINGEIIEQDLDVFRHGHSIAKFWGTHYEMGYAYGYLFADDIYYMVLEAMELVDSWGYSWPDMLTMLSFYTYKPDCIADEFSGIADGVNDSLPAADLTSEDIRAVNMFGDISYLCRSVSSWGSTAASSEFTTITTRRLDYYTIGLESQYHHVIAIFLPSDGSPQWINFAWPGFVSVATGVNEFGTVASLHDYSGSGTSPFMALPRVMACRYALTMVTNPDISTHLDTVFTELNTYGCSTPGFLNYYVPNGYGGVIKHNRTHGYYEIRYPHPDCYDGEAIYTNNSDIDGSFVGSPWSSYYAAHAPSGDISMNGQWEASGPSFHRLTVGVRRRGDIKIWFDGETPGGLTPTIELEWDELLNIPEIAYRKPSTPTISAFPNPFNSSVTITLDCGSTSPERLSSTEIYDLSGRMIAKIEGGEQIWSPEPSISSGVFLVRARIGEHSLTKRVVYLK